MSTNSRSISPVDEKSNLDERKIEELFADLMLPENVPSINYSVTQDHKAPNRNSEVFMAVKEVNKGLEVHFEEAGQSALLSSIGNPSEFQVDSSTSSVSRPSNATARKDIRLNHSHEHQLEDSRQPMQLLLPKTSNCSLGTDLASPYLSQTGTSIDFRQAENSAGLFKPTNKYSDTLCHIHGQPTLDGTENMVESSKTTSTSSQGERKRSKIPFKKGDIKLGTNRILTAGAYVVTFFRAGKTRFRSKIRKILANS